MKRRDAIRALVGLPLVSQIAVARLGPTDTLVVESAALLSDHQRAHIVEQRAADAP
jgi:hypothetical protein